MYELCADIRRGVGCTEPLLTSALEIATLMTILLCRIDISWQVSDLIMLRSENVCHAHLGAILI